MFMLLMMMMNLFYSAWEILGHIGDVGVLKLASHKEWYPTPVIEAGTWFSRFLQ